MVTIRVDVTQPILDWDGVTELHHQKIQAGEVIDALDADGNPKIFTVRNAIAQALTSLLPSEAETGGQSADIKDDVFRVMCNVSANDHAELDDKDRTLITERARGVCNALITGRIGQALDAGEPLAPKPT